MLEEMDALNLFSDNQLRRLGVALRRRYRKRGANALVLALIQLPKAK
jgi:hypothetical protein